MNDSAAFRRWCGGALLACMTAVLAALAMPVHPPEGREATDSLSVLPPDVPETAPEDLDAFVANRRWGVSLREIRDAEAAKARPAAPAEPARAAEPTAPAINPALAKIGFVGLIVTRDQSAVLLASPDGGVARFEPGDTLPDGRTLVSVTDNSLKLRGGDGLHEEVLSLFPRVRVAPPAGGRGDAAGGSRSAE